MFLAGLYGAHGWVKDTHQSPGILTFMVGSLRGIFSELCRFFSSEWYDRSQWVLSILNQCNFRWPCSCRLIHFAIDIDCHVIRHSRAD